MTAFDAIADPNRRKILDLLKRGEMTAGELAGHFSFSWPALSQHLSVLKKTGLVKVRRDGRFLWYRADPEPLERDCAAWVLEYTAYWREHLGKLKTLVETPKRPVRKNSKRDRG